jgi:hypothetical protein
MPNDFFSVNGVSWFCIIQHTSTKYKTPNVYARTVSTRLMPGCLITRYVSFCKTSGGADCPTSETVKEGIVR